MLAPLPSDLKVTEVTGHLHDSSEITQLVFLVESKRGKLETTHVYKDVYLSLGSNLGERANNLKTAVTALGELGRIVSTSSYYETEPVEFAAQPWFLNCAVRLSTQKMPKQLLSAILELEKKMGRRRVQKNGPRIIDIDILLFGNSIIDTKSLVVPHPAMHQRRFVLEPLSEIASEIRHPVLKRTIRELRDALPPGQSVRRVEKSSPQINAG